jgi:ABC-type uncharacterized transport system permease subunit
MVALLAVLVLLPMFWLLLTSLRDADKHFTLEHYKQLFTDAAFVKPLVTTLWTSAAVGVICLAVAAMLARAYDLDDKPDSAIAVYERYVNTPTIERTGVDAALLSSKPPSPLMLRPSVDELSRPTVELST